MIRNMTEVIDPLLFLELMKIKIPKYTKIATKNPAIFKAL